MAGLTPEQQAAMQQTIGNALGLQQQAPPMGIPLSADMQQEAAAQPQEERGWRQKIGDFYRDRGIDPFAFGMTAIGGLDGSASLGDAIMVGRQARLEDATLAAERVAGLAKTTNKFKELAVKQGIDPNTVQIDPETGILAGIGPTRRLDEQFIPLPQEEVIKLGLDPNAAYQKSTKTGRVSKIGSGQTINVNTGEENLTFQQQLEKQRVDRDLSNINNAFSTAQDQLSVLPDVQAMRQLNATGATGPGVEVVDAAKRFAVGLGEVFGEDINIEGLSDVDAIRSKGMDFVMKRIAGTKGAISEKEMKAFAEASPGLSKTTAGNEAILNFYEAAALSSQQRAQFLQAYAQKNGSLAGAERAWNRFTSNVPRTLGKGNNFAVNPQLENPDAYMDYLDSKNLPPLEKAKAQTSTDVPNIDDEIDALERELGFK